LRGERDRVPPTPPLPRQYDEKKVFVVLRGRDARAAVGLSAQGRYRAVRSLVENENGELSRDVVFHGFSTVAEGEEYWRSAVGGRAPRL